MEGLIKGIQIEASRRKIEGGNKKVWTLGLSQVDDDMHGSSSRLADYSGVDMDGRLQWLTCTAAAAADYSG